MRRDDMAAVSDRMLVLEDTVSEVTGQDTVPLVAAVGSFLSSEPTAEFEAALEREVGRARIIANGHYARALKVAPDHPEVLAAVAFLQGVTFARAITDVRDADDD